MLNLIKNRLNYSIGQNKLCRPISKKWQTECSHSIPTAISYLSLIFSVQFIPVAWKWRETRFCV